MPKGKSLLGKISVTVICTALIIGFWVTKVSIEGLKFSAEQIAKIPGLPDSPLTIMVTIIIVAVVLVWWLLWELISIYEIHGPWRE